MQSMTTNKLLGTSILGAVVAATLLTPPASAVVVQVNGEIIPDCADNIAYALARGELAGNVSTNCPSQFPLGSPACWSQAAGGVADCTGTAAPTVPVNTGAQGSQGPLNPVNDASVNPQVFAIPKVAGAGNTTVFGKVTATFIWRNTAYYRNSFGWYNVGDDVTTLTNLHPILPSWPPPPPGTTPYDQAGEGAPFQATVDFQAQFTAGTYKGGFVGFYLMTPESQADVNTTTYPNWDTCNVDGNPRGYYPYAGTYSGHARNPPTPPANSCVGYMYFTESALNGDGNYVHSLIYQTKVLDPTLVRFSDFYFSFEDTYRSNDIGYADNTIFVQGLVTPCVPKPEICNGLDDDCDGVIDNNPVDASGSCSQIANNHPGVGICKAGTEVCRLPVAQGGVAGTPGHSSNDALFCDGEVGPAQEACDGLDDNCDGVVDDPNGVTDPTKQVWGATTNSVPLPNECASLLGSCLGSTECVNGTPTCVDTDGPAPEKCDGKDDNCNGIIDDNPSDVGAPCYPPGGTPVGICKAGVTVCLPGNSASDTLQCQGWVGPDKSEVCNGLDDNCNGKVDDNPVDVGPSFPCTPAGVSGVCTPGYFVCVNGARVCANFGFGTPETCNGKDDNCDGIIDDNPIDANLPCGSSVGACKQGTLTCRLPNSNGGQPDVPGHSAGDVLICDGATGPTAEQCDGIDNNCDGVVDDGPDGTPNSLPGVGVDCSTSCGNGKTVCKDGSIQCVGTSGGTVEVCNGVDDDCDGIIDDNPIDAGGPCGTIVINSSVPQNPDCKLGTLVCRLPDSQGGVPGQPGHSIGDQLECDGQVAGSPEECNGIDDDCNGVVDDNVPGQGAPCPPAGLTLPLTGECRPGELFCIGGSMKCEGAIGPSAPVCDGKDHNCDGQMDVGPCANPLDQCIRGACRPPCGEGEFSNCPGGTTCAGGYCVPPDCTSTCGAGTVCNLTTGQCDETDGGGATASAGGGGSMSTPDGGASLNAGGASSGGGAPDAGTLAGAGGSGRAGSTGSSGGGNMIPPLAPPDTYGLATGGGGCACRATPARTSGEPLLAAVLVGGVLFRRRSRRPSRGGRR